MDITARFQRLPGASGFQPQSIGDTFADGGQGNPGRRLGFDQPTAVVRRDGEDEFKIFAVAEGVVQGRSSIVRVSGGLIDWDRVSARRRRRGFRCRCAKRRRQGRR